MGRVAFLVTEAVIILLIAVVGSQAAVTAVPTTSEETVSAEGNSGKKCQVKLFAEENLSGAKFITDGAVDNLADEKFNDVTSSAQVIGPCAWIFYQDYYYTDPCIVTTGKYPTTYFWGGLDNVLTSLRPLPPDGTEAIVLYEAWFAGRELVLKESNDNLFNVGFSDITTTIAVTGGYWKVFRYTEFGGTGMELGPGYYIMPGDNDYISSVKKLEKPQ